MCFSHKMAARIERGGLGKLLIERFLGFTEFSRADDLNNHIKIPVPFLGFRQTTTGQSHLATRRGARRDLHLDGPIEGRHFNLGTQGCFPGRDGQIEKQVVTIRTE